MKSIFLILGFISMGSAALFSQTRTEPFRIALPEQKVAGSLYRSIGYVDAREDTVNMGFVQLGAFNTKARVIAKTPLASQLAAIMEALTGPASGNGELFFQLRRCSFAEVTSSFSERGFFFLRASLYARSNDRFSLVGRIDTVVTVKSMDVTQALLRNAGATFSHFISSNLQKTASDSVFYSYRELEMPDSIEKTKLKIYTTTNYAEGLYRSYQSFFNQAPDQQMTVREKKGVIRQIEVTDSAGKPTKLKSKDVYAVVYGGQPYIATDYGYYPLTKKNDDFYFVGKAKVSADPASQIAAGVMFGLLGSLLTANSTAEFEMKLDHQNGGFIQVREIRQAYPE